MSKKENEISKNSESKEVTNYNEYHLNNDVSYQYYQITIELISNYRYSKFLDNLNKTRIMSI